MAKIIITGSIGGEIIDPNDIEVIIQKTRGDRKSFEKLNPDRHYTCEASLQDGDIINVTYKGVLQRISDSGDGSSITTADSDADVLITISGKGADWDDKVQRTIENDVAVKLTSVNLKEPLEIKLTPNTGSPTRDQAFWDVINSHRLDFGHYRHFIDEILGSDLKNEEGGPTQPVKTINSNKKGLADHYSEFQRRADSRRLPFNRTEAYSLLKFATEKYVEHVYNLCRYIDDTDDKEKFELSDYVGKDKVIPYYESVTSKIKEYFKTGDDQSGFLKARADVNLTELIWNYWYEEGMVGQTIHAIARRFQNIKGGYKDPLLNFALDPLRPLNNILWGYIQDAQHRLTLTRLNYEFTSEYDLFVAHMMPHGFNPADRRSKFLQSFHRLIYEATEYFVQSDNTTIRPDGFKLLNALRDTHRILAEGAHNQFGDLPTVARIEMLIAQWILARPEVREFLGGRVMVPYEEPWMDRVDSMKTLQGWDNTSISFYRDLAVYGEKIILGIRYGNWANITRRDHATNWADSFRDAIQRYIHSYYTITGVDLSAQNVNVNSEEKYMLPGIHIGNKLQRERAMMRRY